MRTKCYVADDIWITPGPTARGGAANIGALAARRIEAKGLKLGEPAQLGEPPAQLGEPAGRAAGTDALGAGGVKAWAFDAAVELTKVLKGATPADEDDTPVAAGACPCCFGGVDGAFPCC